MDNNQNLQPIEPKQRYALMDALRGLALLGILQVNLRSMGAPSMAYGEFSVWSGALSEGALLVSAFFLDGAFWTLFALLFGAGFSVMMEASGPRSSGIGMWAYYRRLFLIAFCGVLHVLLLWWGDILIIYALAGLFLPFFTKRRTWVLLTWAVILISIPTVLSVLAIAAVQLLEPVELSELFVTYAKDTEEWVAYLVEGYRSSNIGDVVKARLGEYNYNLWYGLTYVLTGLGVMLLGMIFARGERFRLDIEHGSFFRRLLIFAIVPAVLGKLAYAYGASAGYTFALGANTGLLIGSIVGGLASTFVLICGLRALYLSGAARWLLESLAAAGRMALTLYLMQSLVAGLMFYGYGLGLYAEVPPYAMWGIGLVIFALQVVFARIWFTRFKQGPLEFLLRGFTYWGSNQ